MLRDYRDRKNATVLLVSHSMDDVAAVAENVIVLHRGEVLMSGSVNEVFRRADQLRSVGLSVPQITEIVQSLSARGVLPVTDVYTLAEAGGILTDLYNGSKVSK